MAGSWRIKATCHHPWHNLKGPVPPPTTAHACSQTGALAGCERLPDSSWHDCWDEGPNVPGCPQPRCTLAAARQSAWQRILGEHFGPRAASLIRFTVSFAWGPLKEAVGFGTCRSCQVTVPAATNPCLGQAKRRDTSASRLGRGCSPFSIQSEFYSEKI